MTLQGSTFNTLVGVYVDHGSLATAVLVGSNDDCSSGVTTSCVTFVDTNGLDYAFQVDGVNGDWGSVSLRVFKN